MDLNNLDLLSFLPGFMREDTTAKGFAYAVQNQLNLIILSIARIQLYTNIDYFGDTVLDELAWQFNIPEYKSDMNLDAKRALLKGCLKTHKERGTPAAVAKVITDIFGEGDIKEWFQYDGNPYYFKAITTYTNITSSALEKFITAVNEVKRSSAVLEKVVISPKTSSNQYYGAALHTGDVVTMKQQEE